MSGPSEMTQNRTGCWVSPQFCPGLWVPKGEVSTLSPYCTSLLASQPGPIWESGSVTRSQPRAGDRHTGLGWTGWQRPERRF